MMKMTATMTPTSTARPSRVPITAPATAPLLSSKKVQISYNEVNSKKYSLFLPSSRGRVDNVVTGTVMIIIIMQ